MNQPHPKPPRFVTKWNNGAWKVFDSLTFSDATSESRRKDADERCSWMNNPPVRRGRT